MDADGSSRWWDLSPFWDELRKIGDQRDQQKAQYASTCNWSTYSTHFIGLLGEKVNELETGLLMDLALKAAGDGGRDFKYKDKSYEIRATRYFNDPHLKQKPDAKFWANFYISVGVDVERRRGRVAGWATQADVRAARLCDYGYGNMLTIMSRNLRKGMPPELPTTWRKTKRDAFADNMFDFPLDQEVCRVE